MPDDLNKPANFSEEGPRVHLICELIEQQGSLKKKKKAIM